MSRRKPDKPRRAPPPDLGGLQETLGHSFADPGLLENALTHSSAARTRARSNERLEFLGDRVLGLVIAGMLLETYPQEDEGKLGYRFSALVRRETLARVAGAVGLAAHLRLSASEEDAGGRDNAGILANALEAVIAALYLDGGLAAARAFIGGHWRALAAADLEPPKDAKTALQEWVQAHHLPLPRYAVTEERGPAHAPEFTVEARVRGRPPALARGTSKQAAEQAAAEALLARIQAGK